MPATMISKCAEANALRKSFPAEMSGLYSSEEMLQAGLDGEIPLADAPADSKTQPPGNAKPAASARPWRSFKGMMDEFAKLHGRLGRDYEYLYYSTLAQFGVAHSNQFKDGDQAFACYQQLLAKVLEIEAANPEDMPDVEMPAEDFDQQDHPEASA
jgi:hypothetical protein